MSRPDYRWVAWLLGLLFAAFGVLFVFLAVLEASSGETDPFDLFKLVVFALVTLGAGAWIGIGWPRGLAHDIAEAQARIDAHGGAPWAVRPDWAAGQITSDDDATPWGRQALYAGLMVGTLAVYGTDEGWSLLWIVVVGLAALVAVAYLIVERKTVRLGGAVLTLSTLPARPGAALEGVVALAPGWREVVQETVRVRVTCIAETYRGRSAEQGPKITRHWTDTTEVRVRRGAAGLEVPVSVLLPESSPETRASGDLSHEWQLEVIAGPARLSPKAVFEVPVFRWTPSAVATN